MQRIADVYQVEEPRIEETSQPVHGALVRTSGTFTYTYTPGEDYFGSDYFTYELCDREDACVIGTVDLTIGPVNDPPTADDDLVTFTEGDDARDITAQLLNGDEDKEDTRLTVVDVESDNLTRVIFSSDAGTVRYDPGNFYDYLAQGETATETFEYTIQDSQGLAATAEVTVQIAGRNNVPVAKNDGGAGSPAAFTVDEDTLSGMLTGSLLDNDVDADAAHQSLLEINMVDDSGSVGQVLNDGELRYDPRGVYDTLAEGEAETDTFTYSIVDPDGAVSNQATVRMTVLGVNDPPSLAVENLSAPITFSPTSTATTDVQIASNVEIVDLEGDDMERLSVRFAGSDGRPDEGNEYLRITFRGDEITDSALVIQSGLFSIAQFITALQSTEYVNTSATPTPGCRQIEFRVTDEFGARSNVETVYIEVGNSVCSIPPEAAAPGNLASVDVPVVRLAPPGAMEKVRL